MAIYYRLSTKLYGGKVEVLMRLHGGRDVDQRAKTGILVDPAFWDENERRMKISRRYVTPAVMEASDAQKKLDELAAYVENRYFKDRKHIKRGWLQAIILEYSGNPADSEGSGSHRLLADMCEKYIDAHRELSESTIGQYKMMAELLRRYARTQIPLFIDTMTGDDLDDLEIYMSKENLDGRIVTRSQNTISTKMKKLHAVFEWCIKKKKLINRSPFEEYEIPEAKYGDPTYLTKEERDAVYAFSDISPAMKIQRDIFIFHCYIGCRVSDLLRLTRKNLIRRDGIFFIDYIQKKMAAETEDVISVPLSDVAMEIISRYEDEDRESLLPFISAQKYNDAIKEILLRAGIDRNVIVLDRLTMESIAVPICEISSSHLARRTFTQMVFSATKSEKIAAELTGHVEGSKAMERYAKLDDKMRKDVIGMIE